MNTLATVLAETIALVAVIAAIVLTVLVFRDPYRAAWLKTRLAVEAAAVLMAAFFAVAVGVAIGGLIEAGLSPVAALVIAPMIVLVSAVGFWRLFNCRERLRRADAGLPVFNRAGDRRDVPPPGLPGGGDPLRD